MKKCKRFPSQEYAASKRRRLKRIGVRAVPELSAAFAAGKVTLRQYDLISRLAPRQQRVRIAALNQKINCAQIAAKVIDQILNRTKDDHVRLTEISLAIREAVQGY